MLAYITVIPKEDKDLTQCSSYRPISLLNADIKLYVKILATRMKGLLSEWINADQVGFIPGREGRDSGVKTLLLLQHVNRDGYPVLFLSIDAKKAFDGGDWGFMMATLKETGIGPKK